MSEPEQPDETPCDRMLPYFVYELRDPRNNTVFYVGKGTRDRPDAHGPGEGAAKDQKILEIESADHKVIQLIIGRYETESEAYAVEATLISWVYNFADLTNKVRGHRARFLRPRAQRDTWCIDRQPPYPHMEGIDRPRRLPGQRTREFTIAQQTQAQSNGVQEKLEALRDNLRALTKEPSSPLAGVVVSEPNMSKPQDCHLILSGFNENLRLMLKLQLTGKHVQAAAVAISQKDKDRDKFGNELIHINNQTGTSIVGKNYNYHAHLAEIVVQRLGLPAEAASSKGVSLDSRYLLQIIAEAVKLLRTNPEATAVRG